MNDIYQMLNRATVNKSAEQATRLPKEEYAKMKQEERQALYDMADNQCMEVVKSTVSYLQYLELQSKMTHTVTNTLLIMAQKPDAIFVKDAEYWRGSKTYIKNGEKGIRIFEPKGDYEKTDGSIGTNYAPKSVFDISQVKTRTTYQAPIFSQRDIISGLVYESPVKLQVLQEFNGDKPVKYSPNSKTIFYSNNLEGKDLIRGLAREYCYAEFHQQYGDVSTAKDKLLIESSAYLLCKKYGIEVNDTSFANDVSECYGQMDVKDIKDELSNIKNMCDDVCSRMDRGIYKSQHAHQNERKENAR